MRLDLIDGVRIIIIALLAYIPTVTFSGWFTAWTAKKCDDDLPERFGFLTLDPFAHVSIFGFALLLIGEVFGNYISIFKRIPGFGRYIMLDPRTEGSKIKVFIEFFARACSHLLMLTFSFFILLFLAQQYKITSSSAANVPSLLLACFEVLRFFFFQNLSLCAIYILFGIADCICFFYNIVRMLSLEYFFVLIAVLLLLDTLVTNLLQGYLSLVQYAAQGLFHG